MAESLHAVHPDYRKGLEAALDGPMFECAVAATKNNQSVYKATVEGVTLNVIVDPDAEGTIVSACFENPRTIVDKALLNALCPLLVGVTPQECADHSVIRLEYQLRVDPFRRHMSGVQSFRNSDPAFALPAKLCRALNESYRAITKTNGFANFYDYDASIRWLQLSEDQKREEIFQSLESHRAELGPLPEIFPQIRKIEQDTKVCFFFPPEYTKEQQQRFLLRAETLLRKFSEENLQLYAEEKQDANRLRQ